MRSLQYASTLHHSICNTHRPQAAMTHVRLTDFPSAKRLLPTLNFGSLCTTTTLLDLCTRLAYFLYPTTLYTLTSHPGASTTEQQHTACIIGHCIVVRRSRAANGGRLLNWAACEMHCLLLDEDHEYMHGLASGYDAECAALGSITMDRECDLYNTNECI